MDTTIIDHSVRYTQTTSKSSLLTKIMNWCTNQEPNRLLWTGIALSVQGCILAPIAIIAILIAGSALELLLLGIATAAMATVLVTNLAALPTKITVPVFLVSIVVDVMVIAAAFI